MGTASTSWVSPCVTTTLTLSSIHAFIFWSIQSSNFVCACACMTGWVPNLLSYLPGIHASRNGLIVLLSSIDHTTPSVMTLRPANILAQAYDDLLPLPAWRKSDVRKYKPLSTFTHNKFGSDNILESIFPKSATFKDSSSLKLKALATSCIW